MQLLAISGSLRAVSSNSSALEAAALLAPPGIEIVFYRGLAGLPQFNPDLDVEIVPDAVAELRREIGLADGLLISSPEYAHGIAGAMKNALDWLVSSLEFGGKPVTLVNTSPRAVHAQAQLREILTTMSARLVEEAFLTLPLLGKGLTAAGIAADPALSSELRAALTHFRRAIRAGLVP